MNHSWVDAAFFDARGNHASGHRIGVEYPSDVFEISTSDLLGSEEFEHPSTPSTRLRVHEYHYPIMMHSDCHEPDTDGEDSSGNHSTHGDDRRTL